MVSDDPSCLSVDGNAMQIIGRWCWDTCPCPFTTSSDYCSGIPYRCCDTVACRPDVVQCYDRARHFKNTGRIVTRNYTVQSKSNTSSAPAFSPLGGACAASGCGGPGLSAMEAPNADWGGSEHKPGPGNNAKRCVSLTMLHGSCVRPSAVLSTLCFMHKGGLRRH